MPSFRCELLLELVRLALRVREPAAHGGADSTIGGGRIRDLHRNSEGGIRTLVEASAAERGLESLLVWSRSDGVAFFELLFGSRTIQADLHLDDLPVLDLAYVREARFHVLACLYQAPTCYAENHYIGAVGCLDELVRLELELIPYSGQATQIVEYALVAVEYPGVRES